MALTLLHTVDLPWTEAALNAACEEVLFRAPPGPAWLLFYRNGASVLWGRNQNPRLECDLEYCRQAGLQLGRRLSGGGTVYQDLGNFNYSFIVGRDGFEPERLLGLVVGALRRCGIAARLCPRRSIWVNGCKVSGTALAMNGKRAMLHGCLLLRADLACLRRVLLPAPELQERGKVASVRSPVMNLAELVPELEAAGLRRALLAEAASLYEIQEEGELPPALVPGSSALEGSLDKMRSPGWIYHHD